MGRRGDTADWQSRRKGEAARRGNWGRAEAEQRSSGFSGIPSLCEALPSCKGLDSSGAVVVCVVQGLDCFLGTQGDLRPLA